ncbi:restriction endonuclease subunit S [Gallibacterium anatis]|uniref:restriction endonuclease subunit S n=1 Tax=Gallibacterium anatis TaxID=750 RepID=UPI00068C4731|nr:restriction endonuclease subunit S [Gallibacterium anatis]
MNTVKIENAYITLVDGDRGKNYPKQNDLSSTGDCLFLSAKNVTKEGFIFNEICFISSEKDSQLRAGKLERGDIVITTRGTIGNIAYFHENIPYQNIRINSGMLIIRADENYWDKYFLFIYLSSKIFQNQLETFISGSAVPQLPAKDLKKMLLPKIALNTQIKIRKIIKSFNDKITLNTQTNQTLEQIAQAIFKHWFIDFAPVHAKANALARGETIEQAELAAMACLSGKTAEKITALKTEDPTAYHQLQQTAAAFPSEFVETEMGQVPKGWEVLKFKDFVKETKEKVGKLQGIEEYSVGNEGIYPRKEKYKKQLAKDPSKNKLIREANIVFGMGNKEVNWGIMRDKIGSVSSAYNIFQINDINHLFLDMFINNIPYYFRDIIKPTSRQGQTIDKEAFLEKAIYYPNKEIINIFLEKITQINELSICIKSQNIYLLSIRDYLLPKLLGGEIKL